MRVGIMIFRASLFLAVRVFLFVPMLPFAASAQQTQSAVPVQSSPRAIWMSEHAEHVYGLPDSKANKKGVLELRDDGLHFTTKSTRSFIPLDEMSAVSAGNERIELWGVGGQLLRMAIPDGGGMAAAAILHHRVDMLTVEFHDIHGGRHAAVFYLPAKQAEAAISSFRPMPVTAAVEPGIDCAGNPVEAGSVLVELPDWSNAEVPSAYRALVYEHVIDRLRKAKQVTHVYREGELGSGTACPQYTIHLAIDTFKPGNQILRSATGPMGMFVSATKMTFNVQFKDSTGLFEKSEQIKGAVRDQSESTGVGDKVAKSLTKRYSKVVQAAASTGPSDSCRNAWAHGCRVD
jgi:hypothetical protein